MIPNLKNIIVVEDEVDIRTILQIALEDIGGFSVKYFSSGPEALQGVDDFQPDLVLLDMMMPGMDGITVFKELQKKPAFAKIPVVFMTAKVQAAEIKQYLSLGAADVLAKPFDPMTLSQTLNTIWKKYHEQ